jgi:hypothetical protein
VAVRREYIFGVLKDHQAAVIAHSFFQRPTVLYSPSALFGRFDLAVLRGCYTINVCVFMVHHRLSLHVCKSPVSSALLLRAVVVGR